MATRKTRNGTGKRSTKGRKRTSTRRAKAPRRATTRKPALATAAAGRRGKGDEEE